MSVTVLNNNQLSGFGYDASGNMTSNGGASYSYDGENRLKTTASITYTYDGDGNRVKKSSGTLYWGGGPMLESDLSGNFQREFIFAGGKRVARRDISGGAVYYYFTDHLGSSDVVTNSSGAIQNESDYFPYGGERVYSQTLASQNYKFTGKERDSESGLDYFEARHYSGALGRFMQPDEFTGGPVDLFGTADPPGPLPYADIWDPRSLNKYNYTYNNPLRYVDPNGHFDVEFKSAELEKMFNKIGTESQSFHGEIEAAKADHNVQVTVQEVGVQPMRDHAPGDAKVTVGSDGKVQVTINVKRGDENTAEHEVGHEKDARTNTAQFVKDAKQDEKDRGGPNQKAHDDRPVEQRANQFKDQVEKERKQYHEQEKQEKKEKK